MAASTYERLSLEDSLFLALETANTPMHLGATAIFDADTVTTPDGGVDLARVRAHIASRLSCVPRYRQRLAYTPVERHPVWVDDEDFDLHYHARHAGLPQPGDERQLKHLVGQIMSQGLDRCKLLWEAWVVEGLSGGRFALVVKAHHCMADGVSAVALFSALLNAVRSGVPEQVVIDLGGWRTRSVFARYNVTSERDLAEALERVTAYVSDRAEDAPSVEPLGEVGQKSDNRATRARTGGS